MASRLHGVTLILIDVIHLPTPDITFDRLIMERFSARDPRLRRISEPTSTVIIIMLSITGCGLLAETFTG